MQFCYNISVTTERDNIKGVEFGETIKVTFDDGSWTEYGYDLIGEGPAPEQGPHCNAIRTNNTTDGLHMNCGRCGYRIHLKSKEDSSLHKCPRCGDFNVALHEGGT